MILIFFKSFLMLLNVVINDLIWLILNVALRLSKYLEKNSRNLCKMLLFLLFPKHLDKSIMFLPKLACIWFWNSIYLFVGVCLLLFEDYENTCDLIWNSSSSKAKLGWKDGREFVPASRATFKNLSIGWWIHLNLIRWIRETVEN